MLKLVKKQVYIAPPGPPPGPPDPPPGPPDPPAPRSVVVNLAFTGGSLDSTGSTVTVNTPTAITVPYSQTIGHYWQPNNNSPKQRIVIPWNALLNPRLDRCIEFMSTFENGGGFFCSQETNGSNFDLGISVNYANNQLIVEAQNARVVRRIGLTGSKIDRLGGLNHFVVQTSTFSNELYVWVNGERIYTGTLAMTNNANPMVVGCVGRPNNFNTYLNSKLVMFRVSNTWLYSGNFDWTKVRIHL